MMAKHGMRSKFSPFIRSNQSCNQYNRKKRNRYVAYQTNNLLHKFKQSLDCKKYKSPHIPLIIMSSQLIAHHIDFDNCIILNNANILKCDTNKTDSFYYDSVPYFVGKNLSNFFYNTFTLTCVKGKKIILLAKLSDFEAIELLNHPCNHPYVIDDTAAKDFSKINPFPFEKFILIASISNEKYKNPDPKNLIDDTFLSDIDKNMHVNIRGDGKKHFKSMGKYFGFGIIAKYSMQNCLSFGAFATKKG